MPYQVPDSAGDVTVATGTSGTALTVAKPPNLTDGDTLIVVGYSQSTGTSMTPPAGFTEDYQAVAAGTRGLSVNRKVISNAAGEPSTYTVTAGGSARWIAVAFRLPGLNTVDGPLDTAPASDLYSSTAPTTLVDPAISTSAVATVLLAINFTNGTAGGVQTFTAPGFTTIANTNVNALGSTSSLDVKYAELAAAGSTGTVTVTVVGAGAANGGGFLIAYKIPPARLRATVPGNAAATHRSFYW